jgi:hypothetical protein
MADLAISVTVLWFDEHMVELQVRACGPDYFSGQVKFYEGHSTAREFAAALRGFPEDALDTRRFGLGNWAGTTSGAGVEFRFSCDAGGHVQVVAHFKTDQALPEEVPAKVAFLLFAEPAGIDRFCAQLEALPLTKGASAELPAA